MRLVQTGMFNLPGISFDRGEIEDDLLTEMVDWIEQSNCGIKMTDRLLSFRNEGHREFFLLRWSDRFSMKDE